MSSHEIALRKALAALSEEPVEVQAEVLAEAVDVTALSLALIRVKRERDIDRGKRPCEAPGRNGQHELYAYGLHAWVCRACGARGPEA